MAFGTLGGPTRLQRLGLQVLDRKILLIGLQVFATVAAAIAQLDGSNLLTGPGGLGKPSSKQNSVGTLGKAWLLAGDCGPAGP